MRAFCGKTMVGNSAHSQIFALVFIFSQWWVRFCSRAFGQLHKSEAYEKKQPPPINPVVARIEENLHRRRWLDLRAGELFFKQRNHFTQQKRQHADHRKDVRKEIRAFSGFGDRWRLLLHGLVRGRGVDRLRYGRFDLGGQTTDKIHLRHEMVHAMGLIKFAADGIAHFIALHAQPGECPRCFASR